MLASQVERRKCDDAEAQEAPAGMDRRKGVRQRTLFWLSLEFMLATPAETFFGTVAWVWLGGAIIIDKIQVPFIYSFAVPSHVAIFYFFGFINQHVGPWLVGKVIELVKTKFL